MKCNLLEYLNKKGRIYYKFDNEKIYVVTENYKYDFIPINYDLISLYRCWNIKDILKKFKEIKKDKFGVYYEKK